MWGGGRSATEVDGRLLPGSKQVMHAAIKRNEQATHILRSGIAHSLQEHWFLLFPISRQLAWRESMSMSGCGQMK